MVCIYCLQYARHSTKHFKCISQFKPHKNDISLDSLRDFITDLQGFYFKRKKILHRVTHPGNAVSLKLVSCDSRVLLAYSILTLKKLLLNNCDPGKDI